MKGTAEARDAIREIVRTLVERFQPDEIVLYGSYAYGRPHESSDIDLFVIKETGLPPNQRARIVRDLAERVGNGIPVQPIVRTPAEIERRLRIGDQFVAQILEQGEVLYSARPRPDNWRVSTPPNYLYVNEWIEKADKDLAWKDRALEEQDPDIAGFFLQQALEKLLKAWLMGHGWRLRKTHDITELIGEAAALEPSLAEFVPYCKRIAEFYVGSRYPEAGVAGANQEEVRRSVEAVRPLIEKLRSAHRR